ncbi:hypothetical protein ACTFIW_005110 [Dictyostelium discoideum]
MKSFISSIISNFNINQNNNNNNKDNKNNNNNNNNNNSNNNKNNNNNNNNNNNLILNKENFNDKLFFKIWRNKYLLKEISYHLRLYNEHFGRCFDFQSLKKYEFRDYITSMGIRNDDNSIILNDLIPWNIDSITFYTTINEELLNKLPTSITSISVNNSIPMVVSIIPSHIKTIELQSNFQKALIQGFLPDSLKNLIFTNQSFQLTIGMIPQSVQYIQLGKDNCNLIENSDVLPKNLKTLKFGYNSTSVINQNTIPPSVTHVELNEFLIPKPWIGFQSNPFPNSVTYLKINAYSFYQIPVPPNVKTLIYSGNFSFKNSTFPSSSISTFENINQESIFSFPKTLKTLTLSSDFNQPLKKLLPNSITKLTFGGAFNCQLENSIPKSIKYLKFGNSFNKIIKIGELTSISSSSSSSSSLNNQINNEINDNDNNNEIEESNLEILILNRDFNQKILIGSLPNSLKELYFSYFFNQSFDIGSLPIGLKKLVLGSNFNQQFKKNQLPQSLTWLELNFDYDQPFIPFESLPQSLTYLEVGRSFNQEIQFGSLPDSLEIIKFGFKFQQLLLFENLPKSIKSIHLSSNYNLLKNNNNNNNNIPYYLINNFK